VERPSAGARQPAVPPVPADPAPPLRNPVIHRVVPGDTLWDIAEHYLGDPFQYSELARLSRIRNPDLIYPGDTIRINRKAGTEETSPLH
jgi:nucleoid-associated protein YgaU